MIEEGVDIGPRNGPFFQHYLGLALVWDEAK
jgi:hypothetical protein